MIINTFPKKPTIHISVCIYLLSNNSDTATVCFGSPICVDFVPCRPVFHPTWTVTVNDSKSRETRCLEENPHAFIHHFIRDLMLEISILTLLWSGCHIYSASPATRASLVYAHNACCLSTCSVCVFVPFPNISAVYSLSLFVASLPVTVSSTNPLMT